MKRYFTGNRRTLFPAAMLLAALCSCTRTELEKMSAEDKNVSGKTVKLIVRNKEPAPEPEKAPEPLKVAVVPKTQPALKPSVSAPEVRHNEALKLILPGPGSSRFLSQESFITTWFLLGPFSIPGGRNIPSQDLIHKEIVDHEKGLNTAISDVGGRKWMKFVAPQNAQMGCVDASSPAAGNNEYPSTIYLYTEIDSPQDLPGLIMHTGSSCYIKVWINGNLVHAYNREPRKADMDQDTIRGISFRKGVNAVLVKCVNVSGDLSLYMRLSAEGDIPLTFAKN